MNFQKEKDYYKYLHINRSVLAEYQKMKNLNNSEDRDQRLSEFKWKVYKSPLTNAEGSQDLSLTPRKLISNQILQRKNNSSENQRKCC